VNHTHIVRAKQLEEYAERRDSQGVIPELVYLLVKQSVTPSICRIPYGDAVNQPGWDGIVETHNQFLEFVPKGRSFWEIGTGSDPQKKATGEFRKRSKKVSLEDKANSSFVFVTPRSSGSEGWDVNRQEKWIKRRKNSGWREIKIIDGVKLADWLREFPAIGRWLSKKIGLSSTLDSLRTPLEHWELIQGSIKSPFTSLPQKVFLVGRDNACTALQELFEGKMQLLLLFTEGQADLNDFISAYIASLDEETARSYCNRCLIIREKDAWYSFAEVREPHVFVADPRLGLDTEEEADLQTVAKRNGHSVIIPISDAWSGANPKIIRLRSPSRSQLEEVFINEGYSRTQAGELAGIGADRLGALRRHLSGFGSLPPYATWDNAQFLAQAGLIGKWDGSNPADREALGKLLGKDYGEWIEIVRQETLRSDTPLIQKNEKWRVIARVEAWNTLGPRLSDDDLTRFEMVAVEVLGEDDPKFDLPPNEHYFANLRGKHIRFSSNLRAGIAESLALLGSRPKALASCTQHMAESTAILVVRQLLENASWERWASLDKILPLLAEAAPEDFLESIESSLTNVENNPFHQLFAQESEGVLGGTIYTSGLLWALETLAWHPDYLIRVVLILGDLASIDPGGNWANRPKNSLANILMPWYPQTCASIEKRKAAINTLLLEQPEVGWKLILDLLPHSHGVTSGCRRPVWRQYIPSDWQEGVTKADYWKQIENYARIALEFSKAKPEQLCDLIKRLSDLPKPTHDILIQQLSSADIKNLPDHQQVIIWETIGDIVRKHRRHADADWAMPEESIVNLETVAESLTPQLPELKYRRLFNGDDFNLFEKIKDHRKEERRISQLRQKAIKEIYESGSIANMLKFAENASSPEHVGHVGLAAGFIEDSTLDSHFLPELFHTEKEAYRRFIKGFVWSRFREKGLPWADSLLLKDWSKFQKNEFLILLPFIKEVWSRAKNHLSEDENLYWDQVRVTYCPNYDDLALAAQKLIQYGRPNASIFLLRLANEEYFDPDLASQALFEGLKSIDPLRDFDRYCTLEILKRLQACSERVDPELLFKIEWGYLPLLHDFKEYSPKVLQNRLASDPVFFHEIISIVFRSKNEENESQEPTKTQESLARMGYHLLSNSIVTPGTQSDGSFNPEDFEDWLKEVKRLTKKSGHYNIALEQIGQLLTHAPTDPDGLWIHKTVAKALNDRTVQPMRSGFTMALFNQRGVYDFSAGEEERTIAKENRQKAEALEHEGFSRFATAMRDFAGRYERQAEREADRNINEEWGS